MTTLRFAILSTARIGKTMIRAFSLLRERSDIRPVLAALASRSLSTAAHFLSTVDQFLSQPLSEVLQVGSYDALFHSPAVETFDAVYIPLPTSLRFPWIARAASLGKHILIEKPLLSEEETLEISKLCDDSNVFVMDNTMFVHHPRALQIERDFVRGVGVTTVTSTFFVDVPRDNIRMNPSLEPTGCLGDLGWYCLRAILMAFRYELFPERVLATFERDPVTNAIVFAHAVLDFPGGKHATFSCGYRKYRYGSLGLFLEDGRLVRMDDFVSPINEHLAYKWNDAHKKPPMQYDERAEFFQMTENFSLQKHVCEVECVQEVELVKEFCRRSLRKMNGEADGSERDWWRETILTTKRSFSSLI